MTEARVERRLAAILAADVAGYSRLMGTDEIETLRGLQGHLRELIRPTIAEHHGRIVKTTGDGILAEFASVVDSVACSIAVQRGMASRNADRPADRRIEFRIGINLGDLIVDGDDIYGDGVNVAARLETLAQPGGICISAAVRDQVRDKLDVDLADIGEQTLKNIARPVHVFRVAIDRTPSAALVRSSLPLPDKPSIAVLPFTNLSGDPNQEYFADGVVEDIITGLARIKWVFVIASNSSFVYKGQAKDVKQVSRELGVRYVLEGSVRKASDRVRITAQLIDATSGTHIWADHYDRSIEDIFAVQDELTINVLGVIEPTLRQAEIERAKRKRPDSLDAYDLYLRALPYAFTAMPQDADKALALLQRAIELEPDYAAAHAIMAWCYEQRYLRAGLHEEAKIAALRHARRAIAMGGDDAAALAMAGFVVAVIEYDYTSATAAFDRSFALSSSSALALGFSSIVRAWKGDDDAAVEQAQRSIRLSPFDPLLYLPYIGLTYAHFSAGRFEEAAEAAGLASQSNPMFSIPYALHAAALANLGRSVEARSMVERLREIEPDITVASAIESARYANRGKNAELGDALRRAGLPG